MLQKNNFAYSYAYLFFVLQYFQPTNPTALLNALG